jgi:hypothetical protein
MNIIVDTSHSQGRFGHSHRGSEPMINFRAAVLVSLIFYTIESYAQDVLVNLETSSDHQSLVINSAKPVTQIQFSGEALDSAISQIGQIRAHITPPIPQDPMNTKVTSPGLLDVTPDPDHKGVVVAVFNPGFGWIGSHITISEAKSLDENLQKLLRALQ